MEKFISQTINSKPDISQLQLQNQFNGATPPPLQKQCCKVFHICLVSSKGFDQKNHPLFFIYTILHY